MTRTRERPGEHHRSTGPSEESSRHQAPDHEQGSAPRAQPVDGDDVRVRAIAARVDLARLDRLVRTALRAPVPAPRVEGLRTVVAVARLRARRREVDAAVAALLDERVVR